MKEKALVTGAGGFIGSHVCDHLLEMGFEVVALDDLSGGFKENVPREAEFIHGDIRDTPLIDQLFSQHHFSYVYHLAAYAAEGLSHFIRRFNYDNNLLGSMNLINASINSDSVRCFVFTSSIAVYGSNQLPMKEDVTPRPEDPYGIAKLAVEQDLQSAREMFGLNSIIFRPHNVYGERQNIGDPYRNVVGIFMNQILQGNNLTIFGDGQQTRAFTHIDDVAPIIAKSVEYEKAYNQVFNIGADQPYTVLKLAETVSQAMQADQSIDFLDARNEVLHAWSAHEKVKEYFGDLLTGISLEEGIRRMAEWAQERGPVQGKKFENIEVSRNMPPFWKKFTLDS